MGVFVIACYRPKPGKTERLRELSRTHVDRLRAEQLATDREPIVMESQDGTVVEVFEWCSAEAIEAAHSNEAVLQMWKEYEEACEFVPLNSLPESSSMFAEFQALGAGESS